MAAELFKGFFKEISILEVINMFQMSNMKGLLEKVGIVKKGGSSAAPDSTATTAEEGGKGNVDEHNALIAMAEAHFDGKDLAVMTAEDLAVTHTRFSKLMAIHKALREQGKTGGAEKLMHIIGHESHLQGTATNEKVARVQKPDGQPERIELVNVRQRTNPAGKLIIRFLTDLTTQEAVELLVSASITDTGKDKTAAAFKATEDKASEVWSKLKEKDTGIHLWLASLATTKEEVARMQASAPYQRLKADLDAATTPEEKHQRKEALQRFVLSMVNDFQNPAEQADKARKAGKWTSERKDQWLTWTFVTVIVVGLIILGVAAQFSNYN